MANTQVVRDPAFDAKMKVADAERAARFAWVRAELDRMYQAYHQEFHDNKAGFEYIVFNSLKPF